MHTTAQYIAHATHLHTPALAKHEQYPCQVSNEGKKEIAQNTGAEHKRRANDAHAQNYTTSERASERSEHQRYTSTTAQKATSNMKGKGKEDGGQGQGGMQVTGHSRMM